MSVCVCVCVCVHVCPQVDAYIREVTGLPPREVAAAGGVRGGAAAGGAAAAIPGAADDAAGPGGQRRARSAVRAEQVRCTEGGEVPRGCGRQGLMLCSNFPYAAARSAHVYQL